MVSPRRIFDDERVRQSGEHAKGWRAIEQHIHCCLFRKAPASAWRHRHATPAQRFKLMIAPFLSSLEAAGIRVRRLDEEGCGTGCYLAHPGGGRLRQSLDYLAAAGPCRRRRHGRGLDLAQHLAQLPPLPIPDRNPSAIAGLALRFGVHPLPDLPGHRIPPDDGVLTLDQQSGRRRATCPWDQLPRKAF